MWTTDALALLLNKVKDTVEGIAAKYVRSVNGQTGDATITIPSNVSELVNDAGYLAGGDNVSELTNDVGYVEQSSIPDYALALNGMTAIPNGSDLNDYKTPGSYYAVNAAAAATITNGPVTTTGYRLYVIQQGDTSASNYLCQLAISNSSPTEIYTRRYTGSTWNGWTRYLQAAEHYYSAGDSFATAAGAVYSGVVTSSSKRLWVTVPVDKSMENITTITVTRMAGGVRTTSGNYLDGGSDSTQWLTNSAYTITASKVTDRLVKVVVDKSSAFTNVTNNTPVGCYLQFTFAFS